MKPLVLVLFAWGLLIVPVAAHAADESQPAPPTDAQAPAPPTPAAAPQATGVAASDATQQPGTLAAPQAAPAPPPPAGAPVVDVHCYAYRNPFFWANHGPNDDCVKKGIVAEP